MEAKEKVQQSFPELQADTDDLGLTEIESLCMNCHDNVSSACYQPLVLAN